MTAAEVAAFLDGYRRSFDAPVQGGTTVSSVDPVEGGFRTETDAGPWRSRAVVVATGACGTPHVPALADELPASIHQVTPTGYRNPDALPDGPVLVVGASASGLQIADELQRSGREVTLSVGEHTRLPRTYRGMDIHWWMDTLGFLDERWDEVEDITRARRLPSLQLVGSPERRTLDLEEAMRRGIRLVGRVVGTSGRRVLLSGSLANACASADLKQGRLLDRIDDFVTEHGLEAEVEPAHRPRPTTAPTPPNHLDLAGTATVVWATGFRPSYPWLPDALLDRKGAIVHDGGVMAVPGAYVLGLPFLRRRKSSFLDGVGPDAEDLVALLHRHLGAGAQAV